MSKSTGQSNTSISPPAHQRWLIIINPAAGNGKAQKQWPKIESLLQEYGYSYSVQFTRRKGHATQLAEDFILKGFRQILAIGGDGTNNEVINGILNQDTTASTEITYTLLPIGTGNDWVKTHGISRKLETFAERLKKGNIKYQDVGLVKYQKEGKTHQRYFANLAGLAYDAYIVKETENNKRILSNKLLFFAYLFKCLFQYKLQSATVFYNGQKEEHQFYSINVGICKFSGGGINIAPHAIPDNGQFALTLIKKISKLKILFNTPRLYNGTIGKIKEVSLHESQSIRIESKDVKPLLLEVDGELIGEAPAEFTIIPKALKIIIP